MAINYKCFRYTKLCITYDMKSFRKDIDCSFEISECFHKYIVNSTNQLNEINVYIRKKVDDKYQFKYTFLIHTRSLKSTSHTSCNLI